MSWEHVGYIGFSKKGTKILIALKHEYFVADLIELQELLNKKRDYVLIYQPPRPEGEKSSDQNSSSGVPSVPDKQRVPV